jgi:MFS family permease
MATEHTKSDNPIVRYLKDFSVLKETKREYWGLQAINVLDSTAYFAMVNIAVVCFSEDFGFTDEHAGYIFTLFSSVTTLLLFVSGLVTDWLGIKRATYISMWGQIVLCVAIAVAGYMGDGDLRDAIVVGSVLLMAPFAAMVQTLFQAGNKRFTTKRSRGAGFNLWYLFMNVGAAASGFAIDVFFLNLGLPRFHIFTLGVVLRLACVVLTWLTIRRAEQLYGPDEEPEAAPDREAQKPWRIMFAVLSDRVFWRFVALISLLLGVRAVFVYLSLLHPKFWLRVIGEDARIGTLQALNPILVMIGLILFVPLLSRFSVYKMLVVGAIITSASLFLQAIPPMGGADLAEWTYGTTVAFLLVLTIGELIWSPRLHEYTAAVAPEGQEGTYFGLAMVPLFGAKTIVSVASGHMLTRWCPEGIGERMRAGEVAFWDSPYAMWVILGGIALVGSLSALALKDWFTRGVEVDAPTATATDESG